MDLFDETSRMSPTYEFDGSKYKCSKCDQVYTSKTALAKHNETKHEGIMHYCNQCDYKCTRKENLNLHIQYEHEGMEGKYACDNCNQKFKTNEALKSHVIRDHEGSAFTCEECEFIVVKSSYQIYHIIISINEQVKNINVTIANKHVCINGD